MIDNTSVRRLRPGDTIPSRLLQAIEGARVAIPDRGGALIHLQFRRYAGCPICSLHLRSFARRHAELVAAGIREVVVFHSSEADLRRVQRQPFPLIADPQKVLYAEFGVGTSPRAVLDPRVWPTAARAVAAGVSSDPTAGMDGGSFGLPADFLIAPAEPGARAAATVSNGRILACKYGVHADDQWTVDELLLLAHGGFRAPLAARATS